MTLSTSEKESSTPFWRDQVFWFVIAIGVGYGSVYNFLPASFPVFTSTFGCSLAQLGQVQLLFFLSSLGFSLVGGPLVARLGLKRSVIVAFAVAAIAILLIAAAHRFSLILVGAALFGFGVSGLVVINSAIISAHFGGKRQSIFMITGLSDASGAMIGPALLGWWLANSRHWGLTWRTAYVIAAAGIFLLIVWALFVRSRTITPEQSAGEGSPTQSNMRAILASVTIYVVVALGFCHGLAQAGMLSFVGQVYINRVQVDAAQAALFLSVNATGMLAGRLLFGWITARWKIPELIVISMCAGAETMWFLSAIFSPSYIAGLLSFGVAGMFVSTIGPSLNSYLAGKFSRDAATAFALFAGLSNLGAAFGPFMIGKIGSNLGVEKGILFAPFFSALLSAMGLIWFLRERANRSRSGVAEPVILG